MEIVEITGGSADAHQRLQAWRRSHPKGFVVNVRGKNNAMIHRSEYCPHLGNAEWEEGQQGWHSMGNSTKVLSESRKELEAWARVEGIPLKSCSRCQT